VAKKLFSALSSAKVVADERTSEPVRQPPNLWSGCNRGNTFGPLANWFTRSPSYTRFWASSEILVTIS
jgi:hypothetical protein